MKKALYADGKQEFSLHLDDETYERVKSCQIRGTAFEMVVEGVQSQVKMTINSDYIHLGQIN